MSVDLKKITKLTKKKSSQHSEINVYNFFNDAQQQKNSLRLSSALLRQVWVCTPLNSCQEPAGD